MIRPYDGILIAWLLNTKGGGQTPRRDRRGKLAGNGTETPSGARTAGAGDRSVLQSVFSLIRFRPIPALALAAL